MTSSNMSGSYRFLFVLLETILFGQFMPKLATSVQPIRGFRPRLAMALNDHASSVDALPF